MAWDSSSTSEFQSSYTNYSLLSTTSKGSPSKMASRGRKEAGNMSPFTSTAGLELPMPQLLARIDTDVLNRIKIFLAGESTNGESFQPPLKQIKSVLERAVVSRMTLADGSSTHLQHIYNIVTEKLISYLPKIKQAQKEMAFLLIDILCLLSVLNIENSLTFPEVLASCLLYFQSESDWGELYNEVVGRLCHLVLPNSLVQSRNRQCLCLTSVLMMVLEACSSTQHHLLLTDTLMILKRDVCLDILTVITYGTHTVRSKALDLLLHYWPIPIPEFRRHSHHMYAEWAMPRCENTTCRHGNNIATTLCLDVSCAIQRKSQDSLKLFILLCPDCDSTIHSDEDTHQRLKLPMPLREIKPNCEFQRICSGKENKVNKAVVTCYNDSCTAIQNGQPIRMCFSCHSKQHKDLDDPTHIYQVGLPEPWEYDNLSSSSTMLKAVAKLISVVPKVTEAPARSGTTPRISAPLVQRSKPSYMINLDISKKGLWLLSHYCTPTTEVRSNQHEWLVHLLALVLDWLQSYYDLLQAAIVRVEEQLTSPGAALVAATAEGQGWVDSGLYEFEKLFTNYSEVTTLIDSHILYWIRSVCDTNSACMVEALRPDLPGCAQVGKMWNKAHDYTARYKRTLTIIYRLDYFHRQGKLDSFADVFNTVMPMWMDKLVDMRSEPGKMEGLQDQLRLIFSTQNKKHEQGLRIFNFIWEMFRSNSNEARQKGLSWLQDLTRLNIPLPYLPHMLDDALKDGHFRPLRTALTLDSASAGSSFDMGVEEEVVRKESLGSASGSEAEPHLLSQSSFEHMDTQLIVNLKSSLTRYILMLDIWLSQLTQLPSESVPTQLMELEAFQSNLIKMLRKVWGSQHDHKETNRSSVCYLCHGVSVWFNLAIRLLEVYAKMTRRDGSAGEDADEWSPNHQRISTRSDRRKQLVSAPSVEQSGHHGKVSVDIQEETPSPPVDKLPRKSIESGLYAFHAGTPYLDTETEASYQQQYSPKGHRRKIAQVQSHSQFCVVSDTKLSRLASDQQGEGLAREATPSSYIIFQLCAMKLHKAKLQPDTVLEIVNCLLTLVHNWRALDLCEDQDTVSEDLMQLFDILWKSLETTSSNTARSCVELLLECAKYLANAKPISHKRKRPLGGVTNFSLNLSDTESEEEEEAQLEAESQVEEQLLWTTVQNELTSSRWSSRFKAADAFTMVVQFMMKLGATEQDVLSVHDKVQASLAHGFCLLVQLLLDKNSNVCARAKYLIPTIKESSLEAMKLYLRNFFLGYPTYRMEVLSTLSLLDSTLPELGFLSVDILTNLLRIATNFEPSLGTKPASEVEASVQVGPKKKASDVSTVVGGPTPKVSTHSATVSSLEEDPVKQKITERILSLLLRHIANPRVDIAESMKKGQGQRAKKAGTIKGRRSTPSSSEEHILKVIRVTIFHDLHCLPYELRGSPVFEVFLNHIFPVLDHNIEFGQTRGMLPFILKLLCFCAAPNQSDYVQLKLDERLRDPHVPPKPCTYSLSALPQRLQAPWLRVFFVILYKYIHDYSEVDPRSHSQGLEMLTLTQWCLQITLNTLESGGHDCSFLSDNPNRRPQLQHQNTIDSVTQSITDSLTGREVPSMNVDKASPSESPELIVKSKSRDVLTPVPEDEAPKAKRSVSVVSEKIEAKDDEEPATEPGVCVACKKPTNEYTEEVVAIATVALGTCCHRLPHTVSGYLVSRIIPVVARVLVPGSFSWQTSKNTAEPPPGSAMAVAKHIIASILTQFGDRRLFLFVFGTDYGDKCWTVFTALAHGLMGGIEREATTEGGDAENEGELTETSVIKYFLQDAVSSIRDVHPHSIVNLAMYMENLDQIEEGATKHIQLPKDLLLWDGFWKKLKGNTEVLRDKKAMHAFLRVTIKLFKNSLDYPTPVTLGNYHAHGIQPITQSLLSIIEFALHNVYIPLGGLVELASLWYRLFQQHSHREAEKLIKLYVSELRKGLKLSASSTEQQIRQDNVLGLIQVLLLEESGYLGYVDGLTTKKCFAPDLKVNCETHSLPVIAALQWDFIDVLNYLSSTGVSSTQLAAQLKLSLALLVALRAQHGRSPPTDRLKRLVSGEPRALLPAPTTFRSTVIHVLQPRWQDYIQSVRILTWLLLGAMSHNYIDAIAAEMKMAGSVSGQCRLLESLNHKLDEVTKGILTLVAGVLQKIAVSNDGNFGYLYLTFLFASTWTVYMELYAKESVSLIVEFWQKLIGRLTYLMSGDMSEIYQMEVLETLNKYVVVRIKEINLSCYSLLVPIWRELTVSMVDTTNIVFPDLEDVQSTSVDRWFKETINELVFLEQEWQSDIST